jgi:hypothetical protein
MQMNLSATAANDFFARQRAAAALHHLQIVVHLIGTITSNASSPPACTTWRWKRRSTRPQSCPAASAITVLLKREDTQPVFSFKLRGAFNKMSGLSDEQRARGVVTASAGNHAQGVALAAHNASAAPP